MERTRFFRRPVVWIILVIIGAIALSSFFTSGPSYHKVDTSVALQQLNQMHKAKRDEDSRARAVVAATDLPCPYARDDANVVCTMARSFPNRAGCADRV